MPLTLRKIPQDIEPGDEVMFESQLLSDIHGTVVSVSAKWIGVRWTYLPGVSGPTPFRCSIDEVRLVKKKQVAA